MIVILRTTEETYNTLDDFYAHSGISRDELQAMSAGSFIKNEDGEYLTLCEFRLNKQEIAKQIGGNRESVAMVIRNFRNKLKLALREERILSQ